MTEIENEPKKQAGVIIRTRRRAPLHAFFWILLHLLLLLKLHEKASVVPLPSLSSFITHIWRILNRYIAARNWVHSRSNNRLRTLIKPYPQTQTFFHYPTPTYPTPSHNTKTHNNENTSAPQNSIKKAYCSK
jgi:hypothetical protein